MTLMTKRLRSGLRRLSKDTKIMTTSGLSLGKTTRMPLLSHGIPSWIVLSSFPERGMRSTLSQLRTFFVSSLKIPSSMASLSMIETQRQLKASSMV